MGNRRGLWLALPLVAAVVACGGGDELPVTERDVVYAVWGEQELQLDMHAPADRDGAPVVIYFLGRGQSQSRTPLADFLADEGVFVFVAEYAAQNESGERILSEGGVLARAMADSAGCSILFALSRASELGSDDPTVVLAGFSLGGALGAHAALFGDSLTAAWDEHEIAGGPPSEVDCQAVGRSTDVDVMMGFGGAYDILTPIIEGRYGTTYQETNDPMLGRFLTSSIGTNPDLKIRLFHGDSDYTVPSEVSSLFAAALADSGHDVRVEEFDGGHAVPTDLALSAILEALDG